LLSPRFIFFLALTGLLLAIFGFIERDWEALIQLFFAAMFFVLFINTVKTTGQGRNDA